MTEFYLIRAKASESRRKAFASTLIGVLAAAGFATAGCASAAVPIGNWGRPADLGLNEKSLAGATVDVRCYEQRKLSEAKELSGGPCPRLKKAFSQLGATIVSPDDPETQERALTFAYIDKGEVESSTSGLAGLAFTFSNGLISLISVSSSEAEFQIKDSRGVLLDRSILRVENIRAYGLTALVGLFASRGASSAREHALADAFYEHARNRLYSQTLRERSKSAQL